MATFILMPPFRFCEETAKPISVRLYVAKGYKVRWCISISYNGTRDDPLAFSCVVNSNNITNRCVVLEESWPLASISSEIAYHLQRYAFDYLDAPVERVTQTVTPFALSLTLIDEALPNVSHLIKSVKRTLYR